MRIHIATDHAGLDFKNTLAEHLTKGGYEVVDHGAYTFDADDDYPAFIIAAAEAVAAEQQQGSDALGVIFGGSGNGEQIAANKVKGIRAALAWNEATARLARQHNNANIVAIGARQHTEAQALELIDLFLAEPFTGEARHTRRINQITAYEDRAA